MAAPEERFVTAGNYRFHYLDWGNEHLPPLLFLHGFAQQAHSWDFASLMVRDRFHVISLDQRGHGDSDWATDGCYFLRDYVKDLELIVAELGLTDLTVCGLSLGGRVALVHASTNPTVHRGLIVVDAGPELNFGGTTRIRDFVQGEDEWESFDALVDHVSKYTRKLRSIEQIRGSVRRAAKQLPDGRWTWKYDRVLRRGDRPRDPDHGPDVIWPHVRAITTPMLLVRGGLSDVLTADAAARVIEAVPGSELVEVPKAAHLVPGDNPAGFSKAIDPFLNRLLES